MHTSKRISRKKIKIGLKQKPTLAAIPIDQYSFNKHTRNLINIVLSNSNTLKPLYRKEVHKLSFAVISLNKNIKALLEFH